MRFSSGIPIAYTTPTGELRFAMPGRDGGIFAVSGGKARKLTSWMMPRPAAYVAFPIPLSMFKRDSASSGPTTKQLRFPYAPPYFLDGASVVLTVSYGWEATSSEARMDEVRLSIPGASAPGAPALRAGKPDGVGVAPIASRQVAVTPDEHGDIQLEDPGRIVRSVSAVGMLPQGSGITVAATRPTLLPSTATTANQPIVVNTSTLPTSLGVSSTTPVLVTVITDSPDVTVWSAGQQPDLPSAALRFDDAEHLTWTAQALVTPASDGTIRVATSSDAHVSLTLDAVLNKPVGFTPVTERLTTTLNARNGPTDLPIGGTGSIPQKPMAVLASVEESPSIGLTLTADAIDIGNTRGFTAPFWRTPASNSSGFPLVREARLALESSTLRTHYTIIP